MVQYFSYGVWIILNMDFSLTHSNSIRLHHFDNLDTIGCWKKGCYCFLCCFVLTTNWKNFKQNYIFLIFLQGWKNLTELVDLKSIQERMHERFKLSIPDYIQRVVCSFFQKSLETNMVIEFSVKHSLKYKLLVLNKLIWYIFIARYIFSVTIP